MKGQRIFQNLFSLLIKQAIEPPYFKFFDIWYLQGIFKKQKSSLLKLTLVQKKKLEHIMILTLAAEC